MRIMGKLVSDEKVNENDEKIDENYEEMKEC